MVSIQNMYGRHLFLAMVKPRKMLVWLFVSDLIRHMLSHLIYRLFQR